MSDIRDCGTSPQRRTSDWASWKSLGNVVVEQRRVPVEVPLSQRTGLLRSVVTIGRQTVLSSFINSRHHWGTSHLRPLGEDQRCHCGSHEPTADLPPT